MANQYIWGDDGKLNKLVETLQNKSLSLHSNLLVNVCENYSLVKKKFMHGLKQKIL